MDTRLTLLRGLLLCGSVLAAVLMFLAPPLPQWGDRHTPHVHKPPLLLSSGNQVEQTFRFEERSLDLVLLWANTRVPLPTEGGVLLDVERDGATREARVAFRDVPPSGVLAFALKPPLHARLSSPGVLRVRLTNPDQTIALKYQITERIYAEGEIRYPPDKRVHGDLAFQLRYQRPALGTRTRQGLSALALALAGIVAAFLLRPSMSSTPPRSTLGRREIWLALMVGAAVAVFYGIFLLRPGFWIGPTDFSKDAAYLASAADALRAGAWPVWSHRTCGGMALLGNPEGNTLSLGTLLALALPPDRALLWLLVLEAGLGGAGAFVLGRVLKLSRAGSVAAAVISLLSASFAYRIVEGLTPVGGAVAFLPWVFIGLISAIRGPSAGPWIFLTGTALAAMFLRGDVHVVVGVALIVAVWCVAVAVQRRTWRPLGVLLGIASVSLLWGNIKLLPYLEQPTLIGGELPPYVVPLAGARLLDDAFFRLHDRTFTVRPLHDKRPETWGNFGMYVGIPTVILGAIGLGTKHPSRWLVALAVLGTFLLSEGSLFEAVLRHMGPLDVLLRIPSRLWSIFTLFLGLSAGIGLDRLARYLPTTLRRVGIGVLLLALTLDLGTATATVFTNNLAWNSAPPTLRPAGPTLMSHASVSPNHERHATKLLRSGFLLPRICGDQNNPPIFTKSITDQVPLADVPSELRPNRILLVQPPGPAALTVRARSLSAWVANDAVVLEHAPPGALHLPDGSLEVVTPRTTPSVLELRFVDPLAPAEQLLFFVLLSALGLAGTNAISGRRRGGGAPVNDTPAESQGSLSSVTPPSASFPIRIIIPCYNEAANLPRLVGDIASILPAESYRIYAVNDGSRDATLAVLRELATRFPITVLDHGVNKGVAAAFRTGFATVLRDAADNDVVALMEGDGTSTPSLLPEMIRRIRRGADVVIASRYRPGGGYRNFPLKRLILSKGANAVFRLFFPIAGATDYSIFYRAYTVPPLRAVTERLGDLFIESTTFLANAEILVKLRPYVRRVEEVPFLYDYGKKKGRTGMKVWKNLRSYLAFLARHAGAL